MTCPGHQGCKYRSNLILNHRYIAYIESTGAAEAGIVKIKAPAEWQPSAKDPVDLYNPSNMSFTYEMLWRLKSITNLSPPAYRILWSSISSQRQCRVPSSLQVKPLLSLALRILPAWQPVKGSCSLSFTRDLGANLQGGNNYLLSSSFTDPPSGL